MPSWTPQQRCVGVAIATHNSLQGVSKASLRGTCTKPTLEKEANPGDTQCCTAQDCSYEIRRASSGADLRAAAFLRALSFYSYPEGRSPWAQQVQGRTLLTGQMPFSDMLLRKASAGCEMYATLVGAVLFRGLPQAHRITH